MCPVTDVVASAAPAVGKGVSDAVDAGSDAAGIGADMAGVGSVGDAGASFLGGAAPDFVNMASQEGLTPIASEAVGGGAGLADPIAGASSPSLASTPQMAVDPGSVAAETANSGLVQNGIDADTLSSIASSGGMGSAGSSPDIALSADSANAATATGSTGESSSPFSALGNLFGGGSGSGKGISGTSAALGALAMLGQMFSKPSAPNYGILPGPSSTAATSGPLFNSVNPNTGYINRSQVAGYTPSTGSYYTYGQQGEPPFFTNNQLNLARGGALHRHRMLMAAHAAAMRRPPMFDSSRGDHFVRGGGGGQDDDRNAKLSSGEWVADANFVSALGDGNNEAGARRLYAMRQAVMKDKGMKHVVPPKLKKSPLQYLASVSRKAS